MKKLIIIIFCIISIEVFSQNKLKIATFNIQNFGLSKLAKKEIVDTLAAIVRTFDLIAIQEISDVSNKTAKAFLDSINKQKGAHYKLACSKRTGLQPNDKPSQEQYAFYYNYDKLILIDTSLYDDTKNDFFQREPYIASFKTKNNNFKFIICTVHTDPTKAVNEIKSLIDVANWIPKRFINNNSNVIFCGDFNASCSYATPNQLASLAIHKNPYNWIIPDTTKTNLSATQNCAYDRFVVTNSLVNKIIKWSVYRYFKSTKVSDHWPVYIELTY